MNVEKSPDHCCNKVISNLNLEKGDDDISQDIILCRQRGDFDSMIHQTNTERDREKIFKRPKLELERPNSGQDIVNFINNKVKEFEKEAMDYTSDRKKKHKSKHCKEQQFSENGQIITQYSDFENINHTQSSDLFPNSISHTKQNSDKRKNTEIVDSSPLASKQRPHSENVEDLFTQHTKPNRKSKKNRKKSLETFAASKCNDVEMSDIKEAKHKRKHNERNMSESEFDQNNTETFKKKHKHHKKETIDNSLLEKKYLKEHSLTPASLVNSDIELSNDKQAKDVEKYKKKHKKQNVSEHEFELNTREKHKNKKQNTETTHKSPLQNEIKRKRHYENVGNLTSQHAKQNRKSLDNDNMIETQNIDKKMSNSSHTKDVEKHKRKSKEQTMERIENLLESLGLSAVKHSKSAQELSTQCSPNKNDIIQSSLPEFRNVTHKKSKRRHSDKLDNSLEKGGNIPESPSKRKEKKNNKNETSNSIDLSDSQDLSVSTSHQVNADHSELLLSTMGVSILNHENEYGANESNVSEIYTLSCSQDLFTHPVNNNSATKSNIGSDISINNISQESDDSSILGNIANKNKYEEKNKCLFNSTSISADEHDSSQNRHNTESYKKKSKKSKTQRSPIELPHYVDIHTLDYKDIGAVKDAMDICLLNKHILLTEENIQALENLHIVIPWNIPISHTIETRMSSVPTKKQQNKFQQLGIKFKTGPYNLEEDNTIIKNWEEFCDLHNLPVNPHPFLYFKVGHKTILSQQERTKFVQYLGRGLDDRMLYSIYLRFRKLFTMINKGKYNLDEDDIIMTYTENCSTPSRFSELATLLRRDRNSVIKRHRTLFSQQSNHWTMVTYQNLIKQLILTTGTEHVTELQHVEITNENWETVSQKLKMDFSPDEVKQEWEKIIYPKLFQRNITKLINILYDDDEVDQNLKWDDIAEDFVGYVGEDLKKTFSKLLHQHVPIKLHNDVRASISYLKNECSGIFNKCGGTNYVYADGILLKC